MNTFPAVAPHAVSRKTVLVGALWATPAVILTTAIPAAAASGDPIENATIVVGADTDPLTQRCNTIETFHINLARNGTPGSGEVTVTLPEGFSFTGTGNPTRRTFPVTGGVADLSGMIQVETSVVGHYNFDVIWYPNGVADAGTFALTTVSHQVTAPLIPAYALSRGAGDSSGNVNVDELSTTIFPDPRGGAASEDNVYIIVADGTVKYFGNLTDATQEAPGVVHFGGAPLANVASVYAWSNRDVADQAPTRGGGFAVTASGALYRWNNYVGVGVNADAITGISGTIRDVQPSFNGSYILTTTGLYFVNTWSTEAISINTDAVVDKARGISRISSYAWGWQDAGVVAMSQDGNLYQTTGSSALTSISTTLDGYVTDFEAYEDYRFALLADGTVHMKFENRDWVPVPLTGDARVIQMHTWRRNTGANNQWAGGTLLLSNGDVVVIQYNMGNDFYSYVYTKDKFAVGGVPQTVVNTWAVDGMFTALTSAGTMWTWKGNPNQGDREMPKASSGFVSNVDIWGWHGGAIAGVEQFYGGGLAGAELPQCVWPAP